MIPYSSFHSCYHKIKPLVRDLLRISYAIQLTLPFSHFCFPVIIITIANRVHQGVRCLCSVLFHPFIGINQLIGMY